MNWPCLSIWYCVAEAARPCRPPFLPSCARPPPGQAGEGACCAAPCPPHRVLLSSRWVEDEMGILIPGLRARCCCVLLRMFARGCRCVRRSRCSLPLEPAPAESRRRAWQASGQSTGSGAECRAANPHCMHGLQDCDGARHSSAHSNNFVTLRCM